MNLTVKDRLTLINQYEILKTVNPKNLLEYEHKIEILKHGFEGEYFELDREIDNTTLSKQLSDEVHNILTMFHTLNLFYANIEDKSEIDKNKITFKGFSGNDEGKQWTYVLFLIKKNKYSKLLDKNQEYNSHFPMLTIYRRMLDEWNSSDSKYQLSKDDIMRIANARYVTSLINQSGISNNDDIDDEMLANIYRKRGRPQTETEEVVS
jgi:uncharacterized protein YfbU (UPF0304 family)